MALVALQLRELRAYRAARPVNQVPAFGGSRRLCPLTASCTLIPSFSRRFPRYNWKNMVSRALWP